MHSGFNPDLFQKLSELEANNFWFQARNQIIIWAINKYASEMQSFLEVGCGTGFVTQAIAKAFSGTEISASEFFQEGLVFAQERVPQVQFVQLDARNLPYKERFSAIGLFDVLEHIKEDTLVLEQIHKALKPNGYVFITVPQHRWLWSAVDALACHERRYSSKELHLKIRSAGFEIIRTTSFVSSLMPVMLLNRLMTKNRKVSQDDMLLGLDINPLLNAIFLWFLKFDAALIRIGCNLPFGGSRLLVAKKL